MQFGLSRVEEITDADKLENDLGRQEVVCAVQLSMKNQILNIIYTGHKDQSNGSTCGQAVCRKYEKLRASYGRNTQIIA